MDLDIAHFIGDADWHAKRRGMALPEDLETVNRQIEVLLSGEGVQAAKLLMAPAPEGGE